MKFKVGDRVKAVRVINNPMTTDKSAYIGKIFTITEVKLNHKYPYGIEGMVWLWCDEELELASFTKSDLKDGMVVEYRDGTRRMVLGNNLFGFYGNNNLILYNDNLEEKNNDDLTIDKVYKSKCFGLYNYFNDIYLELIWKRPKEEPHKEMTIEEIEKELGYKIKIVGNEKS